MIAETVKMRIACDTKNCFASVTVEDAAREVCNMRLYTLGWRLVGSTGRHLCPACVVRRANRRKS